MHIIEYKDGKKDYLNSEKIVAQADRYGNIIKFEYYRYAGEPRLKITDTR